MSYYIGIKDGAWSLFRSVIRPTEQTHGSQYNAVIGPFRTKRGADYMLFCGRGNNPHCQSVSDAERLAKRAS